MSVYAIADLHGRYDLWKLVKEHLQEDDVLYCLGDSIDRGHYGFTILEELLERPNTIMIKGNHEDMMVNYLSTDPIGRSIYHHWMYNGGCYTFWEIEKKYETIKDDEEYIKLIREIINVVNKFSIEETYINTKGQTIILNHCGYTPGYPYHKLWDRGHFNDSWPEEDEYKNVYIVHGHTPVGSFKKRLWTSLGEIPNNRIVKYANGHKINIDLGSVSTDTTVLLNLDTLEPAYFYNKYEPDEIDRVEQEIAEEDARMDNNIEVFPF